MSKTLPDFVSDEHDVAPAAEAPAIQPDPAPTQAAPEAAPAADGRPRGPDGKFAPIVPPEAPAAQPVAAAPAPAEVPPAIPQAPPVSETPPPVPLATALEWREQMTAAKKEAAELREWRAQQEAQARRTPPPTFDQDPAAAVAHQQQQFQHAMFEQRRDFSRRFAEVSHGKESVDAAYSWAEGLIDQQLRQSGRSALNDEIIGHPDPVGYVVDQWRRDQIASKVDPKEYEAFLAWKAGGPASAPAPAQGIPVAAAPAPAIPPSPAAPRASLAAAPSAATSGSAIPRDGASTYGAMFQN